MVLLDESVISKLQLGWNESGKGQATFQYVKNVTPRESFVVDFGLEISFLFT